MSFKYYSILLSVLVCLVLPSRAFGQYLQREVVNGKTYAIIYSEGLAGAAQWKGGMKMMRNGTTIRHQVSKGNGTNLSINDRIPLRFIIAPTDVANVTWIQAGGVTGGNGNLNADFVATASTGCGNYHATAEGTGRKWRVPTQRELQLIWLFRDAIAQVYKAVPMETASPKRYWAATEKDAYNAWYFDFMEGVPGCSWQPKTTTSYVRCVSDY